MGGSDPFRKGKAHPHIRRPSRKEVAVQFSSASPAWNSSSGSISTKIAGRRAVSRNLAGQRLNQQRMILHTIEQRQQVVARSAHIKCSPQFQRAIIIQSGQEKRETTVDRPAGNIALQIRGIEACADQNL